MKITKQNFLDFFKSKKNIAKLAVVAVLILAIIVGSIVISVNKVNIEANLIYSFMPKSLDISETSGFPYTLYKQKKENFDVKENNNDLLQSIEYYYYDDDGNKVVVEGNEKLTYNNNSYPMPGILFLVEAGKNLAIAKKVGTALGVVIPVVIVVLIIILWYKRWSKKQDEEKEKKYGGKKAVSKKGKKRPELKKDNNTD